MQIQFSGDNLHEMSVHVFYERMRGSFDMSSAEIFTQHAKR